MSATKFIELFRSSKIGGDADTAAAYNAWKSRNKTWLNYNRKELESFGLSKRVGFAISADMAGTLGVRDTFDKLTKDIKEGKPNRGPFLDEDNGTPIVIFPGVLFDGGVERTLDKVFGQGTSSKAKDLGFIKGHVIGIATGGVLGIKESILASKAITNLVSKPELDSALKFLDVLADHLRDLDIASSTIKNFNSKILAKYSKSSRRFLVELQPDDTNAKSAKAVAALSGRTVSATTGIRGLMTPGGHQKALVSKLVETLKSQGLLDKDKLLNFETSPPMLKLIEDEFVSAISGKKKKLANTYTGNVVVGSAVGLYVNEQEKRAYINKLKKVSAQVAAYKTKLQKNKDKATSTRPLFSLTSLQALINSQLQDVISANMGDGDSRNVLNYRTGRFAASATVERMSESRAGMVTAFYAYMKNPYQTFEPGFKQGSPKSRDPKLLIAKSIREIAATKIGARLRAISV